MYTNFYKFAIFVDKTNKIFTKSSGAFTHYLNKTYREYILFIIYFVCLFLFFFRKLKITITIQRIAAKTIQNSSFVLDWQSNTDRKINNDLMSSVEPIGEIAMNEVIIFAIDRDNEPKYFIRSALRLAHKHIHAQTNTNTNRGGWFRKRKVITTGFLHTFTIFRANTLNGSIVSFLFTYK